jgi:hypothetical protein
MQFAKRNSVGLVTYGLVVSVWVSDFARVMVFLLHFNCRQYIYDVGSDFVKYGTFPAE